MFHYKQQLAQMKKLIESGFPASRMVLRIDPIFPTEKGVKRVSEMLNYYHSLGLPENEIRYRISIVDEYPHVRERYKKLGFTPMYGGSFYPSDDQRNLVGNALSEYPYQFDTCAEDILAYKFPATLGLKDVSVQRTCRLWELNMMVHFLRTHKEDTDVIVLPVKRNF